MAKERNNTKMRKTTIELTEEQYFFLKEKALELQKQNQGSSIVSIIRELVEKDKNEWKQWRAQTRSLSGPEGVRE